MDEATEADVRHILRSGLRRFWFPVSNGFVYQWRWREKHAALSAEAVFDDGTVAVSGGTVTLTGGTWPSDLTNYFIVVDGHTLFVTSRDGDTTATVSHTQLTVDSGTSYEARKYRYALPSDFQEWLGGVVYTDGNSTTGSRMLIGSSESDIRLRYAIGQGSNDKTTHYALTSTPDADGYTIVFWPVPAPEAIITGVYLSIPDDELPADLTTPGSTVQVGPAYAEAVLEAILTAAEEYNNDTNGVHSQRFEVALAAAIAHDRAVGGNYDFSHQLSDPLGPGRIMSSITFQ